ncbi:MAG: papain-like cysteine protease family protein [Micropruina sp.]|uniref:papain-like cysteine protease family protein n=1 Tax=Micropruina sp. TaxID=2737536 RepID=UPI0039E21F04
MPQTVRKYWGALHGRATLNFNWGIIDHDSVVVVTASEYTAEHVRFIGAATISADNVAPHGPPYDPNHGVTFVVNIGWDAPLNVVTDITVLDAKPVEIQTYVPEVTDTLRVRLQYQQCRLWCWIATAVTIDHFYDPASSWTQCRVMTEIGQEINGFPTDTQACPTQQALDANPALATRYADPYAIGARYVLDDPALGIDTRYLKSGGVTDSLKKVGNLAGWHGPNLTLADIAAEIGAGRPVVAGITWTSGGSHYVIIAGVQGEGMLILDPVNGQSFTEFGEFPSTYFGGATLDGYAFTQP